MLDMVYNVKLDYLKWILSAPALTCLRFSDVHIILHPAGHTSEQNVEIHR
jgi:hypothetical protein